MSYKPTFRGVGIDGRRCSSFCLFDVSKGLLG
jgi:hypothetical protein